MARWKTIDKYCVTAQIYKIVNEHDRAEIWTSAGCFRAFEWAELDVSAGSNAILEVRVSEHEDGWTCEHLLRATTL